MDQKIIGLKDSICDLIININKRIDDISNSCKSEGRTDDERLINLLDDLQTLAEGIDIIKEYYEGIDIMEFMEKLNMMESALNNNDILLFADTMQFELKDLLSYWKDCLI